MTHSAAMVVAQFIMDQGLAIAADASGSWKIYTNTIPSENDRIVAVMNTGGLYDGRLMKTGETLIHPSLQIFTRSPNDPEVALKRLEDIQAALALHAKRTQVTVDGTDYLFESFTLTMPATPLGQEEKNRRFRFVLNGNATITEL